MECAKEERRRLYISKGGKGFRQGERIIQVSRRKVWGTRRSRFLKATISKGVINGLYYSGRVVSSRVSVSTEVKERRGRAYNLALHLFIVGYASEFDLYGLPLVDRYKHTLPRWFLRSLKVGGGGGNLAVSRVERIRHACVRSMRFYEVLKKSVGLVKHGFLASSRKEVGLCRKNSEKGMLFDLLGVNSELRSIFRKQSVVVKKVGRVESYGKDYYDKLMGSLGESRVWIR